MSFQYKITIQSGPEAGKEFTLDKMELFLGREPGNDLVVNDPEVSRRHARLKKIGTQYLLEDMGSTNGTFLQGNRITLPVMLQSGDEIKIGERVVIRYEISQIDPNATVVSVRREVPAPERQIVIEPALHEQSMPPTPVQVSNPKIQVENVRPEAEMPHQVPPIPVKPPVQVPPIPATSDAVYAGKTPQQPVARKKRSTLLVVLLIILGVVLVFCVIPWIIIDITNSYCLFLPGVFNAIQPGTCL